MSANKSISIVIPFAFILPITPKIPCYYTGFQFPMQLSWIPPTHPAHNEKTTENKNKKKNNSVFV